MSEKPQDKKPTEVPQYQLTERAYINDKLLEEGTVIYFKDVPGPHMLPLNAAAQAQVEKWKHTWIGDPIRNLTIITPPGATPQP